MGFGRRIPPTQPVVQKHLAPGQQEAQEPEQRADVAEAQKQISKSGQQQRYEEERGGVIIVRHGKPKISGDLFYFLIAIPAGRMKSC
jgi:tyrosyl-tRNA synthetase